MNGIAELEYELEQINTCKKRRSYLFVKRAIDIICSLFAIILLSPIYLIIALAVYISDPGKVLYGQTRVGKNGVTFSMWKFRSMYIGSDKMIDKLSPEQIQQYKTEFKIDNDPRITKVGKIIRKLSLDELPQFVNVLKGEMSLVGPRPIIESEIKTYYSKSYKKLLSVKPGVTGYWQAYARNNATYQSGERQRMEMYYIDNASLLLDIKILFQTVISVLKKNGAQ
ncbi:sugar transferase [uncultured Ruminococcus sp.]|uniref:sugar transferase n=1 Tax=uncultured Ruminococcus sp. TaxID=165186 RepID=UPI0025CEB2A6|nr:sugar transferase [uncultured Ruminococcus sp.]